MPTSAWPPKTIYPVRQQALADCFLCCVKTLTGLDLPPIKPGEWGVHARRVRRQLARRGWRTYIKRKWSPQRDTGIIDYYHDDGTHCCVLWGGRVYDPEDGAWHAHPVGPLKSMPTGRVGQLLVLAPARSAAPARPR